MSGMTPRSPSQARALTRDALVWDNTLPWGPDYADADTLPRFHAAGVDLISLTVMGSEAMLDGTVRQIARVRAAIHAQPDRMVLCASADDVVAAKAAGKLGVVFNLQETNMLEGKLELVQAFYDLGVRHMLLAYNARNHVGDGCAERTDGGLSRWGLEVVAEMNRVGMLVDGTHTGYRTTMDAMAACTAPFIFSHCNAHAVYGHYRNIRDDQIRACAATGGVVGLNGLGEFLNDDSASSAAMFRHMDHMVQLVGARHVGLGLDYVRDAPRFWGWVRDNAHMWPAGPDTRTGSAFAQPEQVEELTEMMVRAGYDEGSIRGILGENWLRVARQVWR